MSEHYPRIPDGSLCVHRDYGVGIVTESFVDRTGGVPIRYYRVLVEWADNETAVAYAMDMDVKPYS